MILVTGVAGFIGFHLVKKLIDSGYKVVAVDNINDFYDVNLKKNRLKILGIDINKKPFVNKISDNLFFHKIDLLESNLIDKVFEIYKINLVFHLASHAGVKQSTIIPKIYFNNNVKGFLNLIDNARTHQVKKFIYASSSSIYPNNDDLNELNEELCLKKFKSIYAASKMSNEIIANTFSEIYNIQTIGLRFFSVYGPYGRPDMSYYIFCNSIYNNKKIELYNSGENYRDFTYIDDVVNFLMILLEFKNKTKYSVYNLGNSNPVKIIDLLKMIENITGKKSKINLLEKNKEDNFATFANINRIKSEFNFVPNWTIKDGLQSFVSWYKNYYRK